MLQIIRPLLVGSRTGTTVTRVLGKTLLGRRFATTSTVIHNFCKMRSANGIKLGIITLNPMNPLSDYHQALNEDHRPQEIRSIGTLSLTDTKATKTSWIGHALQFINFQVSSNNNLSLNLSTEGAENVELGNSASKFKEVLASSKATKDWITNNVIKPGNSAYFIVGYTTIKNPKGQLMRGIDEGGLIEARPSELVRQGMALTAPVVGGIQQVAEVSVERNRNHTSSQQYELNGDAIYAIQYRKLKFTWFKPSTLDRLELGENKWEVVWPTDTRSTDGQEERTLVEAELDPNGAIDLEDMEPVGDHEEVAWKRNVRLVERDGNTVEEEFWVSVDPDMGKRSGSETLRR